MRTERDNAGSTMAEVLVGFAFLMIVLAGLTQIIKISSTFLMEATDLQDWQDQLQEELYKKQPDLTVVDVQEEPEVLLEFYQVESPEAPVQCGPGFAVQSVTLRTVTHKSLERTVYQVLYRSDLDTPEEVP